MSKTDSAPRLDRPAKISPPPRRVFHSEDEFRAWLRTWCEAASFTAVAKYANIDPAILSNIVAGRVSLGPKTLARFGFHRQKSVLLLPIGDDQEKG
jgi:hypothetical protein